VNAPGTSTPRPHSLVIGVGARAGVAASEVLALIRATLAGHGLAAVPVRHLATVEGKAAEPGLAEAARVLGVPLVAHPAAALAAVRVPHPSAAALAAVGTPSVCEAAALIDTGGELVVPKRGSAPPTGRAMCTVAVALTPPPAGTAGHRPGDARTYERTRTGEHVNPQALLLVGHGFRDEESAEVFRSFVDRLGKRLPGTPVTGGVVGPPLAGAVAELAAGGAAEVTAVALTLAPSGDGHGAATARDEIAAALAAQAEAHAGTTITLAPPLSGHPRLLALLESRVDAVLDGSGDGARPRTPRDRAATTVLLVGEGSMVPAANAELARTGRLLWEGRGLAGVETAFVSVAAPDVPTGLDRCVRLGARRVVVLPYVLFGEAAAKRARLQSEGWAEAHGDVDVRHADPIGPDDALADVVAACWEQAAPGAAD
jgi:sirohydrochlorin cobaltochelatase